LDAPSVTPCRLFGCGHQASTTSSKVRSITQEKGGVPVAPGVPASVDETGRCCDQDTHPTHVSPSYPFGTTRPHGCPPSLCRPRRRSTTVNNNRQSYDDDNQEEYALHAAGEGSGYHKSKSLQWLDLCPHLGASEKTLLRVLLSLSYLANHRRNTSPEEMLFLSFSVP